jgi:hypothetical protein
MPAIKRGPQDPNPDWRHRDRIAQAPQQCALNGRPLSGGRLDYPGISQHHSKRPA